MPLAVVIMSGTTPSWSQANQSPVRQKPVWISSATKTTPFSVHHSAQPRQEAIGGYDEAALAEDRLDHHAGDVAGTDLLVDHRDRAVGGLAAADRGRLAERIAHRRPVHLAGERAEALLVGHVLGRHRHREVGTAVVGVVEDDDGVAAGVRASDLDGVLDRLGAGVEQHGLLGMVAGRQLGQQLADLDVRLVRGDHEAGVGELRDLLLHPADDLGRGVADAGHRDAGRHVDQ